MWIEMTGPPTSGKSSLVKRLKSVGIVRGPVGDPAKIPAEWKPFRDFVTQVYSKASFKKLPDKTLRALASAWKGQSSKKWMVFDELLILCGFSLAIRMPEYAEEYFSTVPLPTILVVLNASEKVLLERNLRRGDKNRPDKTRRCIDAHAKYLPILEERKCNILQFDTSSISTLDIVRRILTKLEKFEPGAK
jgi:tRNA uridine 5-carbamoylmethylation protein Kti12